MSVSCHHKVEVEWNMCLALWRVWHPQSTALSRWQPLLRKHGTFPKLETCVSWGCPIWRTCVWSGSFSLTRNWGNRENTQQSTAWGPSFVLSSSKCQCEIFLVSGGLPSSSAITVDMLGEKTAWTYKRERERERARKRQRQRQTRITKMHPRYQTKWILNVQDPKATSLQLVRKATPVHKFHTVIFNRKPLLNVLQSTVRPLWCHFLLQNLQEGLPTALQTKTKPPKLQSRKE